jgi:LPXTG-site transpeptidase (sortase) family protein
MAPVRLRGLLNRSRRPFVITASVAVIATGFFPLDGNPTKAEPLVQRVIATPVPIPFFTPMKLAIPKIGMTASVEPVGTQTDGAMGTPRVAGNIGWWAGRKAGKGNLLLDGHHDWNGRTGPFYRLADLKKGDEVIVTGDNPHKKLTYQIIWVKNYDRDIDARDLLGNKSKEQVATLITCGGTFDTIAHTHRERVVARASLVSA